MTVVPIEIQLGRNRPQVLCYAEIRFCPLGGLGRKRGDVLSDFERLSSELNRLRLLRVGQQTTFVAASAMSETARSGVASPLFDAQISSVTKVWYGEPLVESDPALDRKLERKPILFQVNPMDKPSEQKITIDSKLPNEKLKAAS